MAQCWENNRLATWFNLLLYSLQPRAWASQAVSIVVSREYTLGLYAIGRFLVGVPAALEGAGVPAHTIFDRYIKTWIFPH